MLQDVSACGGECAESPPVAKQTTNGKISWADLTDSEFKAKKLNWADLSEELLACDPGSSIDTDTASTETPSHSWTCVERASSSENEGSDVDNHRCELKAEMSTEASTEYTFGMAASDVAYWSWPDGDRHDYICELAMSGCDLGEAWSNEIDCYRFASAQYEEQATLNEMEDYTPMQQAHCKAMAAAFVHQQAIYQFNSSVDWWHMEGFGNCAAHQEAYSKALALAKPRAKNN